jgi:hypothetical protein
MRINEIVNGILKNPQIDGSTDFSKSTIVGNREGYSIHQMIIGESIVLMILDKDGTYKGYIIYKSDGHFIEAYVKEQFRRMGVMSTLMLYVLRNIKTRLYINADDVVSDMSRHAFKILAKQNKIRILDKSTGDKLSNEELHTIFSSMGANDYALIIEHTHKAPADNFNEIVNEDGSAVYNKTYDGTPINEFFYD